MTSKTQMETVSSGENRMIQQLPTRGRSMSSALTKFTHKTLLTLWSEYIYLYMPLKMSSVFGRSEKTEHPNNSSLTPQQKTWTS